MYVRHDKHKKNHIFVQGKTIQRDGQTIMGNLFVSREASVNNKNEVFDLFEKGTLKAYIDPKEVRRMYIYVCVCVFMCVCVRPTRVMCLTYIYAYIDPKEVRRLHSRYVCVCVSHTYTTRVSCLTLP
jgi:hypothetical protein